jgi:NAD(P)-dependent dehydrogenase (short-subunit alcohol dehydrogenase family)
MTSAEYRQRMADMRFDGKVALVTGAGNGLGREHALLLASRGCAVVVNDLGGPVDGSGDDRGAALRVAAEINAAGGVALADTHSVSELEGAAAMVTAAVEDLGRIDIVVNNAGILRDKSFLGMTPEVFDPVIDVHLKGSLNVTRAAWLHFREQEYGRVILTSSAAGLFGNPGQANYAAAKASLVGLMNVLIFEGRKYNINTNVIAPVAETQMTSHVIGKLSGFVGPELVSPVVAYLAHESCETSGHIYSVGGGRVARVFIGLTQGWGAPGQQFSIEDVRDHFAEIEDLTDFTIPRGAPDDHLAVRAAAKAAQEAVSS